MFRIPSLSLALALATATAAFAQLPPQPPPPKNPMNTGNEKEREACHPDVMKFCKSTVDANPEDVLGILGCLQKNRSGLSSACANVLKSHGQ
jgi:hypothetical protein